MKIDIDKKYRKEFVTDENDKFQLTWQIILVLISFILYLLFALIVPVLPSKYGSRFPESVKDYLIQVKNAATGVGLLFLITIICVFIAEIRKRFDIFFGFKKVAIFKAIKIYVFGTFKIVRLNDGHFLTIKQADKNFYDIKNGNVFEIERTATHKLLGYKIMRN